MYKDIYKNTKVLVTGHTGFKGSWLCLWLEKLGANVTGISLPPSVTPNHWSALNLNIDSRLQDIRDSLALKKIIQEIRPSIIFHLAAQPLVRSSYLDPVETWSTNVMGTINVLEAARLTESVRAIVAVTTDKCYENKEWVWPYRETDPLGGKDPYSASKGAMELVVSSYRASFFKNMGVLLASARAGNVIGGGDWSEDRLIPDFLRSVQSDSTLEIRQPNSTRPWQHVLDCLSGYLQLGQKLLEGSEAAAEAWNFGPDYEHNKKVRDILTQLQNHIPNSKITFLDQAPTLYESQLLQLDSSKARAFLGWSPVLNFDETIAQTAKWYLEWLGTKRQISLSELDGYCSLAKERNVIWALD